MKKLLIVILSTIFLSGCNRLDIHQPMTTSTMNIFEGSSISQNFIASRDNLSIISICIRNHERVLIPMRFSLLYNNQEIRYLNFNSGNINNEDCTKFQFEPIANSADQEFVAIINTTPPEKEKLIPAILTVEKNGEDLHYKTFYYQTLRETISESITQFPPRIWADWEFFVIWGTLVGIVLALLLKRNRT